MSSKTKPSASKKIATISEYIDSLAANQGKIVSSLIRIVQESAPEANLLIKWAGAACV